MEILPHPDGSEQLQINAPEHDATVEIYGSCPVQGFGTVGGRELYFRARHEHWTFEIADDEKRLPGDGGSATSGFFCEGGHSNAGYMPLQKAAQIVARCLREYADRESNAAGRAGAHSP